MSYVEADIKAALVTAGYSASRIKYYQWKESPADMILIIPAAGTGIMTSTGDLQQPKVQIQVRATSDEGTPIETAKATIWAIIKLLHTSPSIPNVSGCVWDLREPDFWIDDKKRGIFAAEFTVHKAVS